MARLRVVAVHGTVSGGEAVEAIVREPAARATVVELGVGLAHLLR